MGWFLYVVRAADDSLYTGITTDPERRLQEHEQGQRGARYLRGRSPLTLVYQVCLGERALALRAEYAFKRLTRARKMQLISDAPASPALLQQLKLD